MKLIEKLQNDPDPVDSEVIRTRRVPVEDFPLFTAEEPLEFMMDFVASCISDGQEELIPADILQRAREPAPEVHLRKRSKKRKADGESTSSRASKGSRKSGNAPALISVVDSCTVTTSEPIPSHQPSNHTSPQTFDNFDIEVDTNIPLEHDQPLPEHAKILSNLDNFDASISIPPESPTPPPFDIIHLTTTQQNIPVVAPQPENPNIFDDCIVLDATPLYTIIC